MMFSMMPGTFSAATKSFLSDLRWFDDSWKTLYAHFSSAALMMKGQNTQAQNIRSPKMLMIERLKLLRDLTLKAFARC